ncbi:hypothetical protein M405DRAFT_109149 [Rhizopogon salebrosus TDB-379]|nr:hypothetical protein M405DRAFT_109149 [Rhizopogon salebrosus TDB-379]
MAAGCATGIFVGARGDIKSRRILSYGNPSSIIVLQELNRFIVHHESYLVAYSLDLLARVALFQAPTSSLDASMEKIAGGDGTVLFCCAGSIKMRTIIVYLSSKSLCMCWRPAALLTFAALRHVCIKVSCHHSGRSAK